MHHLTKSHDFKFVFQSSGIQNKQSLFTVYPLYSGTCSIFQENREQVPHLAPPGGYRQYFWRVPVATILAFKLAQARILDSKRKFEEASKKYHKIIFTASLDKEEQESCLLAAVVCGVLAPAGPNRNWLLTNLFRDERSVNLLDYKILSKMVLGPIIQDHEIRDGQV
ncbi:COP9 signalosome complex subunit 4 [Puccinia graminis f. sp. tritici]|uniref:COP9 signalosome complex subunit 4 n=1 Tax=Puccinia graminis f. sp. tritici TaxID=56615 RepID=A0A5B0MEM7_PUCGR|nr:COP9 signalosome complex subunit 4 [Puccinia graminis f. sp. tritici]